MFRNPHYHDHCLARFYSRKRDDESATLSRPATAHTARASAAAVSAVSIGHTTPQRLDGCTLLPIAAGSPNPPACCETDGMNPLGFHLKCKPTRRPGGGGVARIRRCPPSLAMPSTDNPFAVHTRPARRMRNQAHACQWRPFHIHWPSSWWWTNSLESTSHKKNNSSVWAPQATLLESRVRYPIR